VIQWYVGDVVRKLRETRGLKKEQLARQAGLRPNTVGDIENNVVNPDSPRVQKTLAKIAVALSTDSVTVTVEGLYAQIPGASLPPTADPVDLETIRRFLEQDGDTKAAVRHLIDQLGLYDDRPRAQPADHDDASQSRQLPRSGT
jgi:transcriptional regulator with XRE-family HTH domain